MLRRVLLPAIIAAFVFITAASAAVDFFPSGMSLSPTSVGPGGNATLTWNFRNSGTSSATFVSYWVVYSHDAIIGNTDDVNLVSGAVGVTANESKPMSSSFQVPADAVTGTRYIGVNIDPNNSLTETSETNNKGYVSFTVTCATAPGSFTLTSPSSGQQFAAGTAQVSLSWGAASGATSYYVYFGTTKGSYWTETTSRSYTVPVSDGQTYWWTIRAVNSCGTTWSSSGDRSFSVGSCTYPAQFTHDAPSNGYSIDPPGTSIWVIWRVSSAAESYNLYFGTPSSPPKYRTLQSYECNVSDCRVEVPISYNTTYYWRAEAVNGCGTVQSSNGTWSFWNPPLPTRDLYASMNSVSGTSFQPGASITANYSTTNSGNSAVGATVTRILLSSNTAVDVADVKVCEQSIGSIGANSSVPGSCTWTLASSLTPGAWYVIAEADATNAVAEDREDNNTSYYPITILPPPGDPDLEATSITVSPTGALTDKTLITISGRITNIGGSNAGPFSWNLQIDGRDAKSGNSGGLAPTGYVSESIITWSGLLQNGSHTIALAADSGNAVTEKSEANNTTTKNVQIGSSAAGVTVITHGFSPNSNCAPYWTHVLAKAIRERRGGGRVLFYNRSSGALQLNGGLSVGDADVGPCDEQPPIIDGSGENIVIFDWAEESNDNHRGYSEAAAEALVAALMSAEETGTIPSIDGIHLIGHSRGTVVNSEVAERLIKAGRIVGQITTLDPHDWGQPPAWFGGELAEDFDVNESHPEYPAYGYPTDPMPRSGVICWAGVGIGGCDNYYQNKWGNDLGREGLVPLDGRWIPGAHNIHLAGEGSPDDKSPMGHSLVHTWYTFTVNPTVEQIDEDGEGKLVAPGANWFAAISPDCRDDRIQTFTRPKEGFSGAIRVGTALCPQIGGQRTPVLFEWAAEGLVNGNFERSDAVLGMDGVDFPGWKHHVTLPANQNAAVVALGLGREKVLELKDGRGRTHNRFWAPPEASAITFRYAVDNTDSARSLEVVLAGSTKTFPVNVSTGCDLLGNGNCQWISAFIPIPANRRGTTIEDLRFQLPSGSSADVFVDDVRLVISGLSAPNNLSLENVNSSSVRLKWIDASAAETGFAVERRTASGTWSQTTTVAANSVEYTDTLLTACTDYEYRLYAYDGGSRSAYSNVAATKTGGCPDKPNTPGTPSAQALSASVIRVQWSDTATNETAYAVEYREFSSGAWTPAGQVNAGTTLFDVAGLAACTDYLFRVYAINASGASAYSPEAAASTSGCTTPPSAPSGASAIGSSSSTAVVTWTDTATTEAGFIVERRQENSSTWTEGARTGPGANTAQLSGLTACTTYYFRVLSFNAAGSSAPSNEAYATTTGCVAQPNTPTNLTAIAASTGVVDLAWNDNSSNETSFSVERKSGPAGTWTIVGTPTVNATAFTDPAPPTCSTLYYRVNAIGTGGPSAWSNESSVRTGGCPCTSFSIDPSSIPAGASAGSQSVSVIGAPAGCTGGAWSAAGDGSWLTVLPASGFGPATVTASWTANSGPERSTTASIAGNTLTVTQSAGASTTLSVQQISTFPIPLHNPIPSAFASGGKIYYFGGQQPNLDPYVATSAIRTYDIASSAWGTAAATLPYEVFDYMVSVQILDNGTYVFGPGYSTGNGGGWASHTKVITGSLTSGAGHESAPFPYWAMWNSGSCVAGGKVYFFGGHDGSNNSDIAEYDAATETMSVVAHMKTTGNGVHAIVGSDGWIYYWRGWDPSAAWNRFERFNPTTRAVEERSAVLPYTDNIGAAHAIHVASENAIYFFRSGQDPKLYKYSYVADTVSDTGMIVPGNYSASVATRDAADERSAYVLAFASTMSDPMKLMKVTLPSGNTAATPPTNLSAIAVSDTTVSLSWSGTSGASSYEIARGTIPAGFTTVATSNATIYNDSSVQAGASYLYKVRAVVNGSPTAYSNVDVATTVIFTDDPIVAGLTTLRAVHLNELRTAANALRAATGLAGLSFTDVISAGVVARGTHLTELRAAIAGARAAAGLSAPNWTHTITPGATPVRAVDVNELRGAVR